MKTLELNPDSPDYALSFGNVLKIVGKASKRMYGINPYKVSKKSQSDQEDELIRGQELEDTGSNQKENE